MDTTTIILLASPLIILQLGLSIAAVVSIVKKPLPPQHNSQKILWICISLFVSLIGAILYFAMGNSALDNLIDHTNESEDI